MTEWKSRKFWTDVTIGKEDAGWRVLLDGRPIRTPFKSSLDLPTEALARLVATEWDAQGEDIRPETMPATRMANSAIDKVRPQWDGVVDVIAAYGETDLLCYRAEGPELLVARQTREWDPLLEWASDTFDARLAVATGVIPVAQDAGALARLRSELDRLDEFSLTAMHDLVSLTGSLVLGLAVARDLIPPEQAWDLSRIDEEWQISQWGRDEEADAAAEKKRSAFLEADSFLRAARLSSS